MTKYPSRISVCLRGAGGRPWYAVAQCELIRIKGVDLAIMNAVDDNQVLQLDPKRWACADPLTGRQMFFSAPGDLKDDFISMVENQCVPEIENHFAVNFEDAVNMQRRDGLSKGIGPSPHPSLVQAQLSLPIIQVS